jgi:hypothetical protein
MKPTKVQLITCNGGDWEVLLVDGKEFYGGHEVDAEVWIKLIDTLTEIDISSKCISDDDMEMGKF